ncbi:alpha/beta fold hydrolase [Nocardia sp. CA-119907]|uniref:alpha/beta fold hydrolase n=1 Tax=Nocardia sp. CA-119907 TaxID=3239973 RepID=UPI003D9693A3
MITEARVHYDGVRTRVLSVPGDGAPIVLVHGYADSANTWREVLIRLEQAGRRALAVDLPGFGEADPRRPGPIVAQLDAFLDAVIAEHAPVVLVGNSLGSTTALHAAARNQERVIAVAALDDPLNPGWRLKGLARLNRYPRLFAALGALPLSPSIRRRLVEAFFARALYGPTHRPDPEVIGWWVEQFDSQAKIGDGARLACQYAAENRYGHLDLVIECPALIVHGAHDLLIPLRSSVTLHSQLPGSRYVVLPNAAHSPQLDEPDQVTRLLLEHLAYVDDTVKDAG